MASERELSQVLARGVPATDIVVTAAVKPRPLLELCVAAGATVVIDNEDELRLLAEVAGGSVRVPVALRLAPALGAGRPLTRFGLAPREMLALIDRWWPAGVATPLAIAGVHFHLDGYAAADRVTALTESLGVVEALRERGHHPAFIDIGGGVPMSYLDDAGGLGGVLERAPRRPARRARAAHVRGARPRPERARRRDHRAPERLSLLAEADARCLARPHPGDRGGRADGRADARASHGCQRTPAALRARAVTRGRLRDHGGTRRVPQAALRRHVADRRRDEPHAVPLDLGRLPGRSAAAAPAGAGEAPTHPARARSRAISSARTASSASS